MQTDGCFTIHRVEIPVKDLHKPIILIPFGDLHRFSPLCDVEKWLNFCKEYKNKKDTYFLGMGDLDDFLSFSERKSLNSCTFHDSTVSAFDEIYLERTKKLAKELEWMRGKILGLIEGNHYGVFQSSITTTQKLCELLGCKYLGCSAFIRLMFENSHRLCAFDIWANHGLGASRTLGSSLISLEKMEQVAEADAYLSGHDHRKYAALKARLRLSKSGRLNQRQILLGRTGSFLKGYVEGEPSYIARRALPPTDLGNIIIKFIPRRKQTKTDDTFYIEIHCET